MVLINVHAIFDKQTSLSVWILHNNCEMKHNLERERDTHTHTHIHITVEFFIALGMANKEFEPIV